jgi:hypothetical protein
MSAFVETTNLVNGGIVATDGITLNIGSFSISYDAKTGALSGTASGPSLHYDVCPTWLSIAIEHLERGKLARSDMLATLSDANTELKYRALEREFRSSMQAIACTAVAFEALFSVMQRSLPSLRIHSRPKKKKTPRYEVVSGAIKLGFGLTRKEFETVRVALKQIFDYRDQSVHPTGDFNPPMQHPVLQVGVEKRQVTFRYDNALQILRFAVALISELPVRARPTNGTIVEYAKTLRERMAPLRAMPILELPPL